MSFIINNYNVDGTFAYKVHEFANGAHEASSGDVDNDGDLDIFSKASRDNLHKMDIPVSFLKIIGSFNFPIWAGSEWNLQMEVKFYWRSTFITLSLVDVDKDGNIDLLVMGHEWDYY